VTSPHLVAEILRADDRVVVVLRGELDANSEPEAGAALAAAGEDAGAVALDLRGLDFIDSSGLKLVLAADRRLRERGVAFSVLRGPAHMQRAFTSAGLDHLLPFIDEPSA